MSRSCGIPPFSMNRFSASVPSLIACSKALPARNRNDLVNKAKSRREVRSSSSYLRITGIICSYSEIAVGSGFFGEAGPLSTICEITSLISSAVDE